MMDTVTAPELRTWQKHDRLVDPVVAGRYRDFRGCLGLALVVASESSDSWLAAGDHVFMPASSLQWATVTDLPAATFRPAPWGAKAMLHWATLRPVTCRYGMPQLARGTELVSQDLRVDPPANPRLARVFGAIQWAMTSTAFTFNGPWRKDLRKLYQALDLDYDPDGRLLLFGDEEVFDQADRPHVWAPRAFLAFPTRQGDTLLDRVTRAVPGEAPAYPEELSLRFVLDALAGDPYVARYAGVVVQTAAGTQYGIQTYELHLRGDGGQKETVRVSRHGRLLKAKGERFTAGDVLAREDYRLPTSRLEAMNLHAQWRLVREILHYRFGGLLRLWFDRHMFRLKPGFVHVDSRIAAAAALGSAVDSELFFDVGPCQPYFRADCDAFIFPTLVQREWSHLRGVLPGAIAYDLTPGDARFLPDRPKAPKVSPELPAAVEDAFDAGEMRAALRQEAERKQAYRDRKAGRTSKR